jgi:HD-GYP domain-containing protein (c-di-GMP phosphodiesterase class II)
MNVVAFPVNVLRLGVPVPVSLRDETGTLLLARGSVVDSQKLLNQLISRGVYVDPKESFQFSRAMAGKLDDMVRRNALIGKIAQVTVGEEETTEFETPEAPQTPEAAWPLLISRLHSLLIDTPGDDFQKRLLAIQAHLVRKLQQAPDAALLVLVQITLTEHQQYSATHAVLSAVLCELAAQHVPELTPEHRLSLRCAALSMNVAMTGLQDQLARQHEPVNARQREVIDAHPADGADLLRAAGVRDERWLHAVEHHHDPAKAGLSGAPAAAQITRLVQRADVFGARLSMRARRKGLSATAAAQAAYLDETGKADPAGAAIIKAVGLYPPGSYVSLANGEVAVVLKRGLKATWPKVLSIVGREGLALGTPSVRDTRMAQFLVKGSVPAHEVKVRLPLARLVQAV